MRCVPARGRVLHHSRVHQLAVLHLLDTRHRARNLRHPHGARWQRKTTAAPKCASQQRNPAGPVVCYCDIMDYTYYM